MHVRHIAALAILALTWSHAPSGTPKSDDAKNIRGTWKVVSLAPILPSEQEMLSKMRVKITEDKIVLIFDGKEMDAMKYRLDPTKKPKHCDLVVQGYRIVEGKKVESKPSSLPGIYELDGDDLKICTPGSKPRPAVAKDKKEPPEEILERPTEFKAEAEKNALWILKRDK